MTVVQAPAYDVIDVVEAELIDEVDDTDVVDLAASDVRTVVDALAVDALAIDVEVVEAELVDVDDAPQELTPDADGTPRRHLRIAPDLVGRRRRVRIAAAGAAVAISATLFAVVGFNVELAQHQIQLQHLQNDLTTAQARYYDLRKQVAESSSPGKIVAAAKERGLIAAPNSYIEVQIPPPPADPTGTSDILAKIHDNAGGSLAPAQ